MSKLYKQENVEGITFYIPVVDDLDDLELLTHFTLGLSQEDYDYCAAVKIELDRRGIKVKVE